MRILALEASTTSAKAMLYDSAADHTEVLTKEYCGKALPAGGTGQAEEICRQAAEAGRALLQGRSADLISLSGTWHSVLLCDREMRPVTRVYQWNDTGAKEICRRYREDEDYVKDYYRRTGCMVNAVYPSFRLEWMRAQGMDVDHSHILSLGSYMTWRMTGERISTRCMTSASGLMNIHTKNYDGRILEERNLKEWQLSRLVDAGEAFPLLKEAADYLGVPAGIPVIPANSDGGLNQIGAGATGKGSATFSVGTSGAIRLTTEKPLIPDTPSTWCYLSPKGYLSGAATNGCCNCTDWVKRRLFPEGTGYDEIEKDHGPLEETPVFLPFLFGERCPGWNDEREGGFVGVKAAHRAGDLYRAAQEGVLFHLYQCYQVLAENNGVPSEVLLSGGILKSRQWTQMAADIFGVPMTVSHVEQGSLLGACVLGMEYLGLIADAADYRLPASEVIEPDFSRKEFYEKKYRRYLEAYRRNG